MNTEKNPADLLDFVLKGIELDTSYPERISRDAPIMELIDSMGMVGLLCDIEQEFLNPGEEIPDHVIEGLMKRSTSVESFCDMTIDYLTGLQDGNFSDDTVYERKHNLW